MKVKSNIIPRCDYLILPLLPVHTFSFYIRKEHAYMNEVNGAVIYIEKVLINDRRKKYKFAFQLFINLQ